jgi:hypothetical protein
MVTSALQSVADIAEDEKRGSHVAETAGDGPAVGLAPLSGGLAAPGAAVLALAAESKRPVGDGTTWALPTPLLGENDGESEIVHVRTSLHSPSGSSGLALLPRYEKGAAGSEDAVTTR